MLYSTVYEQGVKLSKSQKMVAMKQHTVCTLRKPISTVYLRTVNENGIDERTRVSLIDARHEIC